MKLITTGLVSVDLEKIFLTYQKQVKDIYHGIDKQTLIGAKE
jgi:hypothetical protein